MHDSQQRLTKAVVVLDCHMYEFPLSCWCLTIWLHSPHVAELVRSLELFAEEGALQSERVHDIELLEDHDPGCRLLAFLDSESAVLETEQRALLAAHERHRSELSILDSSFLLVILIAAAIEEGVLLP